MAVAFKDEQVEVKNACYIEGCEREVSCRGYCATHYMAIKKKLNPYFNSPKHKIESLICKNCKKEFTYKMRKKDKTFCCSKKCYSELIYGDDRARFYKNIKFNENGCWDWIGGSRDKDGYGKTYVNTKITKVGKYSYELHIDKVPEGMWILHHCDRPSCCNYQHLFLGTAKDNTQDMIKKGRKKIQLGSEASSAKLREEQVKEIKQLIKNGVRVRDLCKKFNVHHATIGSIKSGKSWGQIPWL